MAKIKYGEKTIAEIEAGQSITLHSAGQEMEHDIEIEGFASGEGGGGTGGIIEVDELPTENIDTNAFYLCNGEYYRYVDGGNTWVFNDELTPINKPFEEGMEEVICSGSAVRSDDGLVYDFPFTSILFFGSAEQIDEIILLNDEEEATIYTFDEGFSDAFKHQTIAFTKLPDDEIALAWIGENLKANNWEKYVAEAPFVYFLQSIDDLPEGVAEGSVALIAVEGQRWRLNDELNHFPDNEQHICAFKVADMEVNYIRDLNGSLIYGTKIVYNFSHPNYAEGWQNTAYQAINVYFADETVLAWLNENGEKMASIAARSLIWYYYAGIWGLKGVL